jgi:hypothetical protein
VFLVSNSKFWDDVRRPSHFISFLFETFWKSLLLFSSKLISTFSFQSAEVLVAQNNNSPFLYGCKSLTHTFNGEHKLQVLGSKAHRKTFVSKKDEVRG